MRSGGGLGSAGASSGAPLRRLLGSTRAGGRTGRNEDPERVSAQLRRAVLGCAVPSRARAGAGWGVRPLSRRCRGQALGASRASLRSPPRPGRANSPVSQWGGGSDGRGAGAGHGEERGPGRAVGTCPLTPRTLRPRLAKLYPLRFVGRLRNPRRALFPRSLPPP